MFDISLFKEEISNSNFIEWLEVFDEVKTEKDFTYAVIYSWQQSSSYFNRATIPNIKKHLISKMIKSSIVTFKGIQSKEEHTNFDWINPLREFEATTYDFNIALSFCNLFEDTKSKAILILESDKYFKINEETRDMGESEYILYRPRLRGVIEYETGKVIFFRKVGIL